MLLLFPFASSRLRVFALPETLLHLYSVFALRVFVSPCFTKTPRCALLMENRLSWQPSARYGILAACAGSGVALCVNHQLRRHTPFQRVRGAILGGEIGEVVSLRGSCKGRLTEQGTHLLDLL